MSTSNTACFLKPIPKTGIQQMNQSSDFAVGYFRNCRQFLLKNVKFHLRVDGDGLRSKDDRIGGSHVLMGLYGIILFKSSTMFFNAPGVVKVGLLLRVNVLLEKSTF